MPKAKTAAADETPVFECPDCGVRFAEEEGLQNHNRSHHPERVPE